MHVLISGAAGMIGRKLTSAIAGTGKLGDHMVTELTLADTVEPSIPAGFSGRVTNLALDISDPQAVPQLLSGRPDVIIHLAAIVSGEAEQDFDKGYRINLDGTRYLFDAVRHQSRSGHYCPRLVFASSVAVFGAPMPDEIDDDFLTAPLTSYGTQKAVCELLLQDYTRRGFFDGLAIRLPTICIRPGLPNAAASGFFSSILREPLAGKPAILPVPTRCVTGMPVRARRSGFWFMPRRWTPGLPATGGCSTCPACRQQWPSRSRRCGKLPETRRLR